MQGTKKLFEGRLLKLYLQKRKLPNGNTVELEIIKHPGAILVVPFLRRDKIILIRQYRPVIDSYIWELPAGTFNQNEKPLECAERELAEETGYKAKVWRKLGFIYPAPGYTTEKIFILEARRLSKVEVRREADEVIAVKPLGRNDIIKLLKAGRIVDAKTICALKLAKII